MSPHLNRNRTDCVRVQRRVTSIVNCLVRDSSSFVTSPRVIVNHTPSARVIIVFDNCFLSTFENNIFLFLYKSVKNVIGVHWRMTVGRWTVDRQEIRVDPIPIPPLPFEGSTSPEEKNHQARRRRNRSHCLDAQAAVQSKTTKGRKPIQIVADHRLNNVSE